MAPALLVEWTDDATLLGGVTQMQLVWMVGVVFMVAIVLITFLICGCCEDDKKKKKEMEPTNADEKLAGDPPSGLKTESGRLAATSSVSSSRAMHITSRRDVSKLKPSIRSDRKGNSKRATDSGAPPATKTPISSQRGPATTLQAAPAFGDFVASEHSKSQQSK